MQVEELRWTERTGWVSHRGTTNGRADLVIYFGSRDVLKDGARFSELRAAWPSAHIIGGSATATILDNDVEQNNVVAAAVRFERTRIAVAQAAVQSIGQSRLKGEEIARALDAPDLAGIFVLADGLQVNGSDLCLGLNEGLTTPCLIAGGSTSDATDYMEMLAGADAPPTSRTIAAIGFYGRNLSLTHANASGWDAFGPRRRITRAAGNVLYELDGKPVLDLYDRYLAEEIADGVRAVVMFPLLICAPDNPERAVVRTCMVIDRERSAMTFAGNVPEGWIARLMRSNVDRLALGSAEAARRVAAQSPPATLGERLALMVSCTGRFVSMGQRSVTELYFAADELGAETRRIGFYSYGEIAPTNGSWHAELHNQTMAITGLAEVES